MLAQRPYPVLATTLDRHSSGRCKRALPSQVPLMCRSSNLPRERRIAAAALAAGMLRLAVQSVLQIPFVMLCSQALLPRLL